MILQVTEEGFVNYCLDKAFERSAVRCNREASAVEDREVSFWIKKDSLVIENNGEHLRDRRAWKWRVKPTLDFFDLVLKYGSLDLDCKFILDPSDLTGESSPPDRPASLVGYGTSLLSNHFSIPDTHFLSYAGMLETEVGRFTSVERGRKNATQIAYNDYRSSVKEDPLSHLIGLLREGRMDRVPFEEKKDQALFRGGATNPQRRRLSHSALSNPLLDIKLTSGLPQDESILSPFLSVQEHLEYSYILDIYGKANSWDRSCWVLPSQSILLAVEPSDPKLAKVHTWYSHFLYEYGIVPQLSEDELFALKDFSRFSHLNGIQQNFSRLLLSHSTILNFMVKFLERYNKEFNS